jgi:hypothetical protein
MFGQKNWLVILLTANTLQMIGQKDTAVISLPLPTTIINNMEVINKDALYQLVTDWLKQRTYINTEIVWLLGSQLCFEHVITSTDPDKIDSEIVQFIDTVPFEEVLSKTYVSGAVRQLTAVNKLLITSFIQAFSLHGYTTRAVVPVRLVSQTDNLTLDIAKLTYKKENELERNTIFVVTPTQPVVSTTKPAITEKPKSQLPMLIAVFTILLAVLGFVIYLNQ